MYIHTHCWNRFNGTNGCKPIFFPASLNSLTNSVMLTSCPSPFSSPLSLFILLLHCPSSTTYLILFTDSLQPLTPLFLKEKELKLAGEMNNVTAINSGKEVSVFSCVWGWRRDGSEGRGSGSGVDSSPALYAPFQLFAQMAENEKWFLHGDFLPQPAAISLIHKIFEPLTFQFL